MVAKISGITLRCFPAYGLRALADEWIKNDSLMP